MGKMIAFTDNYQDNSTDAGFEFTFYCGICNEGYKTKFIASKTYKKGNLFRGFGRFASAAGGLMGRSDLGNVAGTSSDILSERFEGMSPQWHKEHEEAFQMAQNEAKGHFFRCPKCASWVCENDWNEEPQLCVNCAPRESVEVAAARAKKMQQDIEQKAQQTQVFSGEIDERQSMCPKCGKPAGQGKFCNNCGAPLGMNECPTCGAKNAKGARFCGECGAKI